MAPTRKTGKGWSIVTSIVGELDTVLYYINDRSGISERLKDLFPVTRNIPLEWIDEFEDLFGKGTTAGSVLEGVSRIAGVLKEADYSIATLKIREMTFDQALLLQVEQAKNYKIFPDASLPVVDRIIDLAVRLNTHFIEDLGVHPVEEYFLKYRQEVELSLQIMQGGKYHDRFWHWLDRFYYETYRPWRNTRQPILDRLEEQALTVLGASHSSDSIPNLDWLPETNQIIRQTGMYDSVTKGRLHVNFWIEPFGLADSAMLLPGEVIVSFAEPGEIFDNFYAFGKNLADRVQALGDPTRLVILRLIRNFGMTNTGMAEYLHLSRPTVSIHAKILREAGLIRSRQDGRIMRHEIIPEEMHQLLLDLERFLDLPPLNE